MKKKSIISKALSGLLAAALILQPMSPVLAEEAAASAEGTILFEDNFEGGELNTLWNIQKGEAGLKDDGTGNYVFNLKGDWDGKAYINVDKAEWKNYSVQADLTINEWLNKDAGMAAYDCAGIVGKKQKSQQLAFFYRRSSQTLELNKNYGNAGHKLTEVKKELTPGVAYTMKLEFRGASVLGYIEEKGKEFGEPTLIYEDNGTDGHVMEYGGAGIEIGGADVSVDDFKVVECSDKGFEVGVNDVTLNKNTLSLEKDKSVVLTAKVLPANASDKSILWSSNDTAIATVDDAGKVTAVSAGSAIITAASKQNSEKTAICNVTVYENIPCETFYYVSTTGSDENDGSKAHPFGSIQKARDTIRTLDEVPDGGVTVYIMPGEYNFDETFMLEPQDSGKEGSPIVYTAYDKTNKPSITSGEEIKGWKLADENLPYTSEAGKGNIYVADVNPDWRFHDLYIDGTRQQVSRQTNSDNFKSWTKIDTNINDNANPLFDAEKGHKIYFGNNSLEGLPSNGDIEMNLMAVGFWNALPVLRDFNYEENSAYLNSYNPLYFIDGTIFDGSAGTYNIMNAYKFIDEPGEWCVDSENGKVYLWPEDDELDVQKVIAPKAYRIIEFNGDKEEGNFENLVENVELRDLSFAYTDRLPENQFPADWVKRNSENPDAAIYMDGVKNCVIEGCTIKNTGTYGIALYHYAQNNKITGNCIVGTGCGGIEVFGYGAGTLDVNKNNVIERNYISDLGLAPYMHAGAISVFGSNNNTIELNKIANVPYSSISIVGTNKEVMSGFSQDKIRHFGVDSYGNFFGQYGARYKELDPIRESLGGGDFTRDQAKPYKHDGNNIVRHNITEEYMMKTDDGGCLYTWGCDNGNVFEENIIYKSQSGHGWVYPLYMDDEVDGVRLEGNRIWAPQTSKVDKGANQWIDNKSSSDMSNPPAGYNELYETITSEAENGWLIEVDEKLEVEDITLIRGDSASLKKDTYPDDATIKWKSSKPAVVTVDEKGNVTGVSKGISMVKAYIDDIMVGKWKITVTNNVALGKEVTVSSHTDWPDEQKECLVDGKPDKKWCSTKSTDGSPHWAVVDLGKSVNIAGWKVIHAASEKPDFITLDFKLQYAVKENPDGANDADWVDADVVTGNKDAITERVLAEAITTRYVRLFITEPVQLSQSNKTARIYELEVFESDEKAPAGIVKSVKKGAVTVPVKTEFTEIELPGEVEVTLEDEQTVMIPVQWSEEGFNPNQTGIYTLKGNFGTSLEEKGLENPNNLIPEIIINVTDKSLLQKTYEYALTLSTGGVVDSAVKIFDDAKAGADTILNNPDATQLEINEGWNTLVDAIHGLGLYKGDKAMLVLLVDKAEAMTAEQDKYVQKNWNLLVDALVKAKAVLDDGDALTEDISVASDALLDAILQQKLKANKDNLKGLIEKTQGTDLSIYTEDSVAELNKALDQAVQVMNDDGLSTDNQEVVDKAVITLQHAIDGLVVKNDSGNGSNGNNGNNGNNGSNGDNNNGNNGNNGNGNQGNKTEKTSTVKTGDSTSVTLLLVVMALCLSAGTVAVVVMKRNAKRK